MPAEFEFKLNYSGSNSFAWNTGDPQINSPTAEIIHRFPELKYPQYSGFRLRIIILHYNTQVEWLICTGDRIYNHIKDPLTVNSNVVLTFQNLGDLPTGNYFAEIFYWIEGHNGTNWTGLESREMNFNLVITNGVPTKTEKDLYTVYYNKSTNSISGETVVNVLNNDTNTELFFEGDGSTFHNGNSFIDNFELQFASSNLLPFQGEYLMNAFLRKLENGYYRRIYPFKVKVIILDADVVVSPQFLDFEVRKSIQEIKTFPISVINPFNKAITITGPSWLTFDPPAGNSTFNFNVSNINPIHLDGGIITGNIEVKYEEVTILIPVKMWVLEFFTHNFQELYNFCLDQKILRVYKNLADARFVKITVTMKFRTPTETKDLVIPFKIPYFQDKAALEIGKKIHRYFLKNRTSIFEEAALIYHFDNKAHLYPCEASFTIEELDINQFSIYEESFGGIKFYPGKRPKYFPFLTNFGVRSRDYNSKHIFSFISGLVTAEELFDINVTKNGLEPDCIARVKVEKWENKISFPDETIITAGDKSLVYYNLPDGKDVINVQWENQNLSPESITFRGLSNKPKDFSHLFQDNVFTGESEKFDTTAVRTINISTGFLLKAEEALIDELMYSKFCILEFNGKYIKSAPSSSKLIFEDISKQLIEFDLEFKINGN